ncbi:MAG: M14 family zinc carboxypeptidase [Ilumatobacteraceae bacterium]
MVLLDPLHPEIVRLDGLYQQTCLAFENGEISAAEARARILNLTYKDLEGRIWRIDTKRSGQHAAFTDEIADQTSTATKYIHDVPRADQTPRATAELAKLDQTYQQTCLAFENGEISSAEARALILNLSYTDPAGRTWRIDTKRSGRRAAFTDEAIGQGVASTKFVLEEPPLAPTQPIRIDRDVVDRAAATQTLLPARQVASKVLDSRRQAATVRRVRTQIFVKVAVAAILLIATLLIVVNHNSPATSTSLTTVPSETTLAPQISQAINIDRFATRGEVPYNIDYEFGRSVKGVPLLVHRRGAPDGIPVLVIGVIHGDETAGLAVMDLLDTMELSPKIDLWLVRSMNPDGQDARTRQNANGVDLNRNFPVRWAPSGSVGYWQYAGPSAASEPETQAMVRLGNLIKPQIVIFYHQDYFRIAPAAGRAGEIRARYAELVQLPILPIVGGTYSGTTGIWTRSFQGPNGVSMTVEFGPSPLRPGEAKWNADAIMTIVDEFF